MATTTSKQTGAWFETPFGRLCATEIRRRPQPSVAEVFADLARRRS